MLVLPEAQLLLKLRVLEEIGEPLSLRRRARLRVHGIATIRGAFRSTANDWLQPAIDPQRLVNREDIIQATAT
jgi:hypothetical protein